MSEAAVDAVGAARATDVQKHRVLVTGATGFVGRAFIRTLLHGAEFEVIATARDVASASDLPGGVVPVAVGEISGETDWTRALPDVRTIVHLAARVHVMKEQAANPLDEFRRVNVEGTMQLARQAVAAGVRRFVYVSSVKVNGETGTFSETDLPAPLDAYGVSKHEAEVALRDLASSSGLQVVVVRPPLVYGAGVKANFRALVNLVARGIPLPFGSIRNRRSFVAVDNLASFLRACVTHENAGNQTFFVSDGHDLSTTELLQHMARAMNRSVRLIPVPASLLSVGLSLVGRRAMAERLLGTLCVDISKARKSLEWVPPLSVDDALRQMVTEA